MRRMYPGTQPEYAGADKFTKFRVIVSIPELVLEWDANSFNPNDPPPFSEAELGSYIESDLDGINPVDDLRRFVEVWCVDEDPVWDKWASSWFWQIEGIE